MLFHYLKKAAKIIAKDYTQDLRNYMSKDLNDAIKFKVIIMLQ